MISFLIRYKKVILIVTLAFFLGSIAYLGLDAYHRSNVSLTAGKVGSQTITTRQVDRLVQQRTQQLHKQGIEVDETILKLLRQQMLHALIGTAILTQSAHKAGMAVSDYEVAYTVRQLFGRADGQLDKRAYEAMVRNITGMTPTEFEEQLRQEQLANRFRGTLYSFYKLTPAEVQYAYKTQHGNSKDFDKNKQDFYAQLMDTKMETAQRAFDDAFNQQVEIKSYLKDESYGQ